MATIQGLNKFGLWTGNNTDINIRGLGDSVTVCFRIGDSKGAELNSFLERYTAVDGVIDLSGLGDIAKAYCKPCEVDCDTETVIWDTHPVIFADVISDSQSTTLSFFQRYLYSAFPVDNIPHPDSFKLFLSRFSRKTIVPGQIDFVSFIDHGQRMVIGVGYSTTPPVDGHTTSQPLYKEISIQYNNSQNIVINKISLSRIVALLAENDVVTSEECILMFDISLFDDTGRVDIISFNVDRSFIPFRTDILYYNMFNCPEVLCLTGQQKRTADIGATFLPVGSGYQKINTEMVLEYEAYTGFINADTRDAVYDLVGSEPVYIIKNNILHRITILDIDVSEVEPHTEPICLKITYRKTDTRRQLFFARGDNYKKRIFDRTFDDTFN